MTSATLNLTKMASKYTTVTIDKFLHRRLVAKLRNSGTNILTLVSRLIEMYLDGEIQVVIPSKKV